MTRAAAQRGGRALVTEVASVAERAAHLTALNQRAQHRNADREPLHQRDQVPRRERREAAALEDLRQHPPRPLARGVYEAMPSPPSAASEHVCDTYARLLDKANERNRETVRGLPRQEGKCYFELCGREIVKTPHQRRPALLQALHSGRVVFVLDLPPFLTDSDPAGNVKTSPKTEEG